MIVKLSRLISKILPGVSGLIVQIDPRLSGKIPFTELTDSWISNPFSGYHEGKFVKCKVLSIGRFGRGAVQVDLSLRSYSCWKKVVFSPKPDAEKMDFFDIFCKINRLILGFFAQKTCSLLPNRMPKKTTRFRRLVAEKKPVKKLCFFKMLHITKLCF
ncbi:putative S1 domain, nucleic acid-binding protein [Helianthus debilis subsp. tardiflorus]